MNIVKEDEEKKEEETKTNGVEVRKERIFREEIKPPPLMRYAMYRII